MTNILKLIAQLLALCIAITIHQFFYALVSYKLGDPVPKNEKRLTLNPLKHIEIVGFVLLFTSQFGWGKPVNTNSSYYKDKKKGTIIVCLAAIVANLVFAAIFGILSKFVSPIVYNLNSYIGIFLMLFFVYLVRYNIVLAVVNLIPIYPLDGYKILLSAVKPSTYYSLIQYEKIIQIVVILLAFAGILNIVLNPIINLIYNLFV